MNLANTNRLLVLALFLTAALPALALDHSGSISSSETWQAIDNPHNVVGNITVQAAATLTLEPGVEVVFDNNRSISVYGQFLAEGTALQGISFLPGGTGNWGSLAFYGSGSATIAHASFEGASNAIYAASSGTITATDCIITGGNYGVNATNGMVELGSVLFTDQNNYGLYGNGTAPTLLDGNVVVDGAPTGIYIRQVDNLVFTQPLTIRNCGTTGLYLHDCEAPTVDNLTLENNAGTNGAFFFTDCGEFMLGAGNSIGGPGLENTWPLSMNADSYPHPSVVLPSSGNTNNNIRVHGGSTGRTFSWPILAGLHYQITANPNISAGGTLTIPDGSDIYLNTSRGFTVYGTLIAEAAAPDGIRFLPSATSWAGINFYTDGSGTLTNCLLQDGSSTIYSSGTGTISLTGCHLDGGNYGCNIAGGNIELSSCTIEGMSGYGLYFNGSAPAFLDGNTVIRDSNTGLHIRDVDNLVLDAALTIEDCANTGLHLYRCESPTLDNLIIQGVTGTNGAIFMQDCGEFALGAGNALGGTGEENSWAVSMNGDSFPRADCLVPTSGNINTNIRVHSGTSTRNILWPILPGVHYQITANPTVGAGFELTIPDGSDIFFSSSRGLNVYGTLTATGTPGAGIDFLPATTGWSGINLYTDGVANLTHCTWQNASNNVYVSGNGALSLDNCLLENGTYGINAPAGSITLASTTIRGMASFGIYTTGVDPVFADTSNLIEDCATGIRIRGVAGIAMTTPITIRGSSAHGLQLNECEAPTVDNMVFEGMTGAYGAMTFTDCGEFTIGGGNSIGGPGVENSFTLSINAGSFPHADCVIPTTGNTENGIRVYSGSTDIHAIWRDFPGIDYHVYTTPVFQAAGGLTIPAGSDIIFGASRGIGMYGTLMAVGTEENPINLITSATSWSGLTFYGDALGTLEHCNLIDASSALYLRDSCDVDLVSCLIEDGNYAINQIGGHASLINCRLINNATYGIYMTGGDLTFGSSLEEWNDIYGNGYTNSNRDFRTGPNDVHAPYVYWGTMRQTEIWQNTIDELDDPELGYLDFIPHANEDHTYVISAVDDETPGAELPLAAAVHQNYPNPFNPSTEIKFELPATAEVRLQVYDISGARVATLLDGSVPAGRHSVLWSGLDDGGRQVASGVYFYRFEGGDLDETRRMTLVK